MKVLDFSRRLINKTNWQAFPRGHCLTLGALGIALLLFSAMTPSTESTSARRQQPLSLALEVTRVSEPGPTSPLFPTAASPTTYVDHQWHSATVKPGDSLSLLFQRVGLPDTSLLELLNSSAAAKRLTRLHPGERFRFQITDDGRLLSLSYQQDRLTTLEFTRTASGFTHRSSTLKPDIYPAYRENSIKHSLFAAATEVGMEDSLVMELATIFGWDIDFALDIRTNDHFKVLYEEQFLQGEKLGNGPILAAEFTNQGTTFRAVRYVDDDGKGNYFTPDGKSMRKAFLRTPVELARISSHFNLRRKHPILNKIRAHKGTDYAAPRGTPIKATGDGRVVWVGTKGGYGRTVIIQHGQSYKTLYAHMNKYGRGIGSGKRVRQGQIIGYVGTSGLATGPHLHYEFHHNGVVRNPVSVRLPKAESIPKAELAAFKQQTQPIVAQLDDYSQRMQIAQNGDSLLPTNRLTQN